MTSLDPVSPPAAPLCLQAPKPAGGFLKRPLAVFLRPWWAFQHGQLTLADLRVWLGVQELLERRCQRAPGTPAHYTLAELQALLQLPRQAPVAQAIVHLEACGLLTWSPDALHLLPRPHRATAPDPARQAPLRAALPPRLTWVPVPRRLAVWLARTGRPGLIATALGVALRCLRYRQGQCLAGGRVAASWIATVFGVTERTVHRSLAALEACGWLTRRPEGPAQERRHGRYTLVNLHWVRPGQTVRTSPPTPPPGPPPARPDLSAPPAPACRDLSPLPPPVATTTASDDASASTLTLINPCFQPLQEPEKNQDPAADRPNGGCHRVLAPPCPPTSPVTAAAVPPVPVIDTGAAPAPAAPPALTALTPAELRDTARLLTLLPAVIARGWLRACLADRLTFVAAAVHALRVGATPGALFVWVLQHQAWHLLTEEDDQQAQARLRAHDAGPLPAVVQALCPPPAPPPLPPDALMVQETLRVVQQQRWTGDPFLALKLTDPTWTRARWDAAQTALVQWRQGHAPPPRQAWTPAEADTVSETVVPWDEAEGGLDDV